MNKESITSDASAYVCPRDAGPAWRAACDAGYDMATVEENLRLTPQERVEKHQRLLDAFLEREGFLNKLRWGQQFIQSYVHTR